MKHILSEHKNGLRHFSRATLLLISVFWFCFALLSGAGELGEGGLIQNIPNALPWLLLFVVVYIAWRWELIGGSFVLAAGIFTIFFFNAFASPVVLFGISLPLILLGGLFMLSWRINR